MLQASRSKYLGPKVRPRLVVKDRSDMFVKLWISFLVHTEQIMLWRVTPCSHTWTTLLSEDLLSGDVLLLWWWTLPPPTCAPPPSSRDGHTSRPLPSAPRPRRSSRSSWSHRPAPVQEWDHELRSLLKLLDLLILCRVFISQLCPENCDRCHNFANARLRPAVPVKSFSWGKAGRTHFLNHFSLDSLSRAKFKKRWRREIQPRARAEALFCAVRVCGWGNITAGCGVGNSGVPENRITSKKSSCRRWPVKNLKFFGCCLVNKDLCFCFCLFGWQNKSFCDCCLVQKLQ